MVTIKVKPLSVNEAWKGRRFKTDKYKSYEKELLFTLPHLKLPAPPFIIHLSFGVSSVLADFDNPVKPLVDILQKKYKFNDRQIQRAVIDKHIVNKGEEYISFDIQTFTYQMA